VSGFLAWRCSYCSPEQCEGAVDGNSSRDGADSSAGRGDLNGAWSCRKNYMLGFGLLLAVLSGLVTIVLALTAKIRALRAIFVPTSAPVENKSFSFSNTTAMQNFRSDDSRELASLCQDLRALQQKHHSTATEVNVLKTYMRLCFDNIRYHEEITLP